jgi:DoxX-like family
MGHRKLGALLWIVQAVLALLFLFTGSMKLLMPAELLAAQAPLPIEVVRFLGACEVAGALGLILPGLLRIRPALTPLAAAGLVALMIGATVLTPLLIGGDLVMTMLPLVVGLLAAFVGYGRWRLAPLRAASPRLAVRLAG